MVFSLRLLLSLLLLTAAAGASPSAVASRELAGLDETWTGRELAGVDETWMGRELDYATPTPGAGTSDSTSAECGRASPLPSPVLWPCLPGMRFP